MAGFFRKPKKRPKETKPDTVAYLEKLDDEALHAHLQKHPADRKEYFRKHRTACLGYYRKEPDDLRKYLKSRLKSDKQFRQWIKDAGYDLNSKALDPIVLGLMWDVKDKKGKVVKPGVSEPFVVSRDLMKEGHMHIRGRTRSGKSALAITPLLQQLIRPYWVHYRNEDECKEDEANEDEHDEDEGKEDEASDLMEMKDAIFIIDLGGDLALFNFARELADNPAHKRKFRFLSLEEKDNWDYFDPFESAGHGEKRIVQIAVLLQKAFSLDHGLAYAASYFTSRNLQALLDVVRKLYSKRGSGSVTLDEVASYLEEADLKDAEEIRMIFRFLTEYPQLKPFGIYDTPEPMRDDIINLERALDKSEVIYFYLPTLSESITARQIAGLALYTLINAAQKRVRKKDNEAGKPMPHAWVFVDEFQQLAGGSYADVLAQASKFGLSLIMANQTTTQLDVRNLNLADIVRDNTYAKIYFTITGEQDIKALKSFSKEDRDFLTNIPGSPVGIEAGSLQEYLTTVLRTDEILDTSATNQHCYALIDDGTGHREPVRLWMDYAMSHQEFRKHKTTPPKASDRDRSKLHVPDKMEPLWKVARKKIESPSWQVSLATLHQKKREEESFEKNH